MEEKEKFNLQSPIFANFPGPGIPLFQYSIIPIVNEANYVLKGGENDE